MRGRITPIASLSLIFIAGYALADRLVPPSGLHAKYFSNPQFAGPALIDGIDAEPSTAVVEARTSGILTRFAVEWSGAFVVHRGGTYTFATTSDDGSELLIDDQRVVNNGGTHGPQEQRGQIELARGVHSLTLRYIQEGGGLFLRVDAARAGAALAPLPAGRLVPAPVSYPSYVLWTVAPYASGAILVALFLLLGRWSWPASMRLPPALVNAHARLANPRVAVAIILIAGATARVIMTFGAGGILWPDSDIFLNTTWAIHRGELLAHDPYRTALYPFFLAAALGIDPSIARGTAAVGVQHALGLIACLCFYWTWRRIFTPIVAFYGALIYSLHTVLLFYEASILSEALFIFVLSLLSIAAVRMIESPTIGRAVLTGFACGVLTLVRPVGQLTLACVLPSLWIGRGSPRQRVMAAVIAGVVNFATVLPWMAVNHREYGFWGIAAGRGLGLFIRVFEIDRLTPPAETSRPEVRAALENSRGAHGGLATLVLVTVQREQRYSSSGADTALYDFAAETARAHPLQFAWNTMRQWALQAGGSLNGARLCPSPQGRYLCSGRMENESRAGFPPGPTRSPRARAVVAAYYRFAVIPIGACFALALLGAVAYLAVPQSGAGAALFFLMTAAYLTLVPALTQWPQDRFRLPVDGVLIVFALWGLRTLAAYLPWTRRHSSVPRMASATA